jgi:protein-S-isoprenylcysteine O-methyltransferase Ste14
MNSSSPFATGAAAVTGAMLGGVISWLCTQMHVAPPPPDVANSIGALFLVSGHSFLNWANRRWPEVPVQSVSVPVVAASVPVTTTVATAQ